MRSQDDRGKLLTYPKDCSTALIKQVLPRFRNPTKFLRASFFLIAELLLLFGPVDDLKLFLLLFPFPLVPSLLFRDFLIAGWFSTPLKKKINKSIKKTRQKNWYVRCQKSFHEIFFVSATLELRKEDFGFLTSKYICLKKLGIGSGLSGKCPVSTCSEYLSLIVPQNGLTHLCCPWTATSFYFVVANYYGVHFRFRCCFRRYFRHLWFPRMRCQL